MNILDSHRLLLTQLSAMTPSYLGTFPTSSDLRNQAAYVEALLEAVSRHIEFIEGDARIAGAIIRKINAHHPLADASGDLAGALLNAADDMSGVAA